MMRQFVVRSLRCSILLMVRVRVASAADDRRDADRAAIRAHIDRIFQAFIHEISADLRATHASNWLGYLESSRTMIRGLKEYMDYTGHFEPNSADGITGYKMREFDMIIQGDAAFVVLVADVDRANAERPVPPRAAQRKTTGYEKDIEHTHC